MKNIFFLFFLFSTFILFSQQLTTEQAKIFEAKTKEKNLNIKNFQADFVQKKHLDFLAKNIETQLAIHSALFASDIVPE